MGKRAGAKRIAPSDASRWRWCRVPSTTVVPFRSDPPTPQQPTFTEAFGVLGVPMLAVVFVSMLWTAWLVCLNIAPNTTANYLMNTAELDDGDFWLILDPEPVLLVFTVLCLGFVIIIYGYVVLLMTCWRESPPRVKSFGSRMLGQVESKLTSKFKRLAAVARAWRDVTGFSGRWRKQWVRHLSIQTGLPDATSADEVLLFVSWPRRTPCSRPLTSRSRCCRCGGSSSTAFLQCCATAIRRSYQPTP